jgi:hypothetical protein
MLLTSQWRRRWLLLDSIGYWNFTRPLPLAGLNGESAGRKRRFHQLWVVMGVMCRLGLLCELAWKPCLEPR